MSHDIQVDTRGLQCPMPIVRAKQALQQIEVGQVMEVLSTDAGSKNDFTAWVTQVKQELLEYKEEAGVHKFYVKKVQ